MFRKIPSPLDRWNRG